MPAHGEDHPGPERLELSPDRGDVHLGSSACSPHTPTLASGSEASGSTRPWFRARYRAAAARSPSARVADPHDWHGRRLVEQRVTHLDHLRAWPPLRRRSALTRASSSPIPNGLTTWSSAPDRKTRQARLGPSRTVRKMTRTSSRLRSSRAAASPVREREHHVPGPRDQDEKPPRRAQARIRARVRPRHLRPGLRASSRASATASRIASSSSTISFVGPSRDGPRL